MDAYMRLLCGKVYADMQTCDAGQAHGSKFLELLKLGDSTGDYSQAVSLLRSMSPNAIDQELRTLEVSTAFLALVCVITFSSVKPSFV